MANNWISQIRNWYHHHHHYQSLNREGHLGHHRWFCNQFSPFFPVLHCLLGLACPGNSRRVHSLMVSSHLFLCLPCLLPPFKVPCKMVLARPDERETDKAGLLCTVCHSECWNVHYTHCISQKQNGCSFVKWRYCVYCHAYPDFYISPNFGH